jgi:hypothetical protein
MFVAATATFCTNTVEVELTARCTGRQMRQAPTLESIAQGTIPPATTAVRGAWPNSLHATVHVYVSNNEPQSPLVSNHRLL